MRIMKWLGVFAALIVLVGVGYGAKGWYDAVSHAPEYAARADRLIAEGKGGTALGEKRLAMLLLIQDPGFGTHSGVDFTTPGNGLTTLAQSLSKRLGFDRFEAGYRKLRQSTFAIGLTSRLTPDQLIALFLDTVEMGNSKGEWVAGFFTASQRFFGKPPAELSDEQYALLVGAMIAPSALTLENPNPELKERARRIMRRVNRECAPEGWMDVWLEGCAGGSTAGQT